MLEGPGGASRLAALKEAFLRNVAERLGQRPSGPGSTQDIWFAAESAGEPLSKASSKAVRTKRPANARAQGRS